MATLFTSIMPDDIAAALGRDPFAGVEAAQVQSWIDDAAYLITTRATQLGVTPGQEAIDYVVKQAVLAVADSHGQTEQVSVDDASVTTRYERSSPRRVGITGEWWAMLGLAGDDGRAFVVDMAPRWTGAHQSWCNLAFGATYCSCGADLTRYEYPLYEGGLLS